MERTDYTMSAVPQTEAGVSFLLAECNLITKIGSNTSVSWHTQSLRNCSSVIKSHPSK